MKNLLRSSVILIFSFCLMTASGCTAPDSKFSDYMEDTKQEESLEQREVLEIPPDPYSKMPEPVEFTTGRALPIEPKIPEGESIEDNDITKFCLDKINVKARVIWTTSDQNRAYEEKVNMLIASNDIPDVLCITVEPYGLNILRKLVSEDMIEDLTKTFSDYASPTLKDFHEKAGNKALEAVTFDGKLMALPSISDIETALPVVWARQDWLDKLGLSGPETVDDVAGIAKAFMEKDFDGNGQADTVGLPACVTMYKGDTNTFDFVFGAYNSYPGDWIRDNNGRAVNGSVTGETRAALAKLQEWYSEGIIDREFALKDAEKSTEPVASGKAGIFQGAWWSPLWPIKNNVEKDPKAEWRAFYIRGVDGSYHGRSYPIVRGFTVVKKGFKHPEAIVKCVNYHEDAQLKKFDWYNKLFSEGGKYRDIAVGLWPVNESIAKYTDEISRRYKVIMSVVDGKVTPDSVDAEGRFVAGQILSNRGNPKKDLAMWCVDTSWTYGASLFVKHRIQQKLPVFAGSTDTMLKKKSVLQDLETKAFLNIIMGKSPIEEFDRFVEKWMNLGGRQITAEVNGILRQ